MQIRFIISFPFCEQSCKVGDISLDFSQLVGSLRVEWSSVRFVVWVLRQSDAVEESRNDKGQDCECDQLSSERGFLLLNLLSLVLQVEVVRPVDKMKNNEPKTFAFITFAREDAAKQLVKQGQSTINDTHTVEIKKVTPKEQMGGGGWGGQGYGGQGGGWGYNDPYGYGGYGGGYGDPYGGYGGYGGGWGAGYGGGAGGKMRGSPRGAPRGR